MTMATITQLDIFEDARHAPPEPWAASVGLPTDWRERSQVARLAAMRFWREFYRGLIPVRKHGRKPLY